MLDRIRVALAAALLQVAPGAGNAQQSSTPFPTKPIRLIVGPGPDAIARIIGQKLTEAWGQQVVIELQPGAGGVIAAQTVARAPADGYSLLLTTTSFAIMQAMQPKLPFSLLTDFAPVGQVISAGFVLVAHPSVPATSLDELIRLAQAKPGFINCASTGPGTAPHLGCEMLRTYAKADVVHVPYNGTPPAVLDLLAGRVHILIATGPASVNLVQEGKLKALAVTGRNRVGALPQIPTMAELGRPELEIPGWNGVHAPAGTPPEVIARLSAEILKAVGQPEVGDKIRAQGFDPDPRSADAFGELVRADVARWTAIVKATGAKPE